MPEPAGAVAVICVELSTVFEVALIDPNFTSVAPVKFVPVITTDVPPVDIPATVPIPVIVGKP